MNIHFTRFVPGYYVSMKKITKHCYNTMVFKTHTINYVWIHPLVVVDWLDERFYKIDTNLISALVTYFKTIHDFRRH